MLRYKTETRPGLVALYDIRPGNGAGQFLQPRSQHGAVISIINSRKLSHSYDDLYFASHFLGHKVHLYRNVLSSVCTQLVQKNNLLCVENYKSQRS